MAKRAMIVRNGGNTESTHPVYDQSPGAILSDIAIMVAANFFFDIRQTYGIRSFVYITNMIIFEWQLFPLLDGGKMQ